MHTAYLHFVHGTCGMMACNQKRISVQEREKWRTKNMHSGVFFSDWLHRRRVQSGAEDFLEILLPLYLRMGKISKFKMVS